MYAPYLDRKGDIAVTVLILKEQNKAFNQSVYPLPSPLSNATYQRRRKVVRNPCDELRAFIEELRTVLDVEEQKWKQWNKTQKDMSDWEIQLINTRSV